MDILSKFEGSRLHLGCNVFKIILIDFKRYFSSNTSQDPKASLASLPNQLSNSNFYHAKLCVTTNKYRHEPSLSIRKARKGLAQKGWTIRRRKTILVEAQSGEYINYFGNK
jgi:hypothetical protein